MVEILIVADDLTGTLDAAAAFIGAGVEVRTSCEDGLGLNHIAPDVRVLAVNSNTRHVPADVAREILFALARQAADAGVTWFVKKTDSVLRGNVGAELEGALAGFGAGAQGVLHFMPSFPGMDRVTENGIYFIDGVPLADTAFAQDPFEPVTESDVLGIIGEGTDLMAVSVQEGSKLPRGYHGIAVYDAASDAELDVRMACVREKPGAHLVAGCAAALAALARILNVPQPRRQVTQSSAPTLCCCGSVNHVSVGQAARAREAGVPCQWLYPAQILDSSWAGGEDFARFADALAADLVDSPLVVVDASTRSTSQDLAAAGIGPDCDTRALISGNLGRIIACSLEATGAENLLVMGGDILLSFLDCAQVQTLTLTAQLAPGVVVSELELYGRHVRVVSKSGGFGGPDMFLDVAHMLSGYEKPSAEKPAA